MWDLPSVSQQTGSVFTMLGHVDTPWNEANQVSGPRHGSRPKIPDCLTMLDSLSRTITWKLGRDTACAKGIDRGGYGMIDRGIILNPVSANNEDLNFLK